jgi:RNA recognition motif-containing protein
MRKTELQLGSRTRIIVKNLPKYVDQARFLEHFSEHGSVTDVKLLRTKCVLAP